jgi:hypothetical protein
VTAPLPAGDLRILDLLTASEAALELGRSVKKVRSLAAAGVLERVWVGSLVRYTPESVAAYKKHLAAGREATR